MSTSDVIGWTKEIKKEYEGRTHAPSMLILLAFIQELKTNGKLKFFDRGFINSNFRRHERVRTVHYPSHSRDKKWIRIAIAIKARYIISTDGHLLEVPPNRINRDAVETVNPERYVAERCRNRNAN
jgi:predicted nucleic acid-binding protein